MVPSPIPSGLCCWLMAEFKAVFRRHGPSDQGETQSRVTHTKRSKQKARHRRLSKKRSRHVEVPAPQTGTETCKRSCIPDGWMLMHGRGPSRAAGPCLSHAAGSQSVLAQMSQSVPCLPLLWPSLRDCKTLMPTHAVQGKGGRVGLRSGAGASRPPPASPRPRRSRPRHALHRGGAWASGCCWRPPGTTRRRVACKRGKTRPGCPDRGLSAQTSKGFRMPTTDVTRTFEVGTSHELARSRSLERLVAPLLASRRALAETRTRRRLDRALPCPPCPQGARGP